MCPKLNDLTHKQFEKLTVIERAANKNGKTRWLCRCECGNEIIVYASSLISGNTKSCGCLTYDMIPNKTRFEKLIVINPDHIVKGRGYYYRCKCDCENEIVVRGTSLRSGETKSCGCLHDELFESYKAENYKKMYVYDTSLVKIKNRNPSKNSKSGILGVTWHKGTNKWQARISFQKVNYHLGYFEKLEEAAQVRKEAEERLFDKFLEWYKEHRNDRTN